MKIMIPLGIYEDNPEFNLPITPEAKQQIDALLPKTQDFTNRLKIVIHPGAKFPVNRWPRGKFLGLVRMLIENLNAFVILVGGKDTSQTCSFIEADVKSNILNLCGKTSIAQTAEIILRSKILVSGDSGPLHLSEAVGTAAVGIYTARDYPNCWYPWSNKSVILRHDVKCQVCFKTNCETRECIDGITVEEVFAACKKICEARLN
jgi:ADP-heptose:LPS heptosyltransferase